jgi:putative ABC transport system permease protein
MFWLNVKIALQALVANKMRSLLTMLGIIIGVSAVIIMVSLGQVTTYNINQEWKTLGVNSIFINNSDSAKKGIERLQGARKVLTYEDAKAVEDECPSVVCCSPVSTSTVLTIYRDQNWNTTIYGVSDTIFQIENLPLESGLLFTNHSVLKRGKVCVIGKKVADNLFGDEDPIDKTIRIKDSPFRVMAVLKEKGTTGGGSTVDDRIYIPYTTYKNLIDGSQYVGLLEALAANQASIKPAQMQITVVLRERHGIKEGKADDFEVQTMLELLKTAQKMLGMLSVFLVFVASISLIVGGIGIMNIMLVSVTERIREIGVRMALGAKGKHIMQQFMIEAVVLCLLGGFIGLAFGFIVTISLELSQKWKIMFSPGAVILSICFSIVIGVIFGFVPAMKASRMDPIEALRSE